MWFGTVVGMGGPIWTIRLHDSRDWAQRQPDCHWFLRHGKPLLIDGFYYLNFRLKLKRSPGFDPGPGIADDPFHVFLQRTWMLHQIPVAIALYLLGGWPWVVWGVFGRVFVSVAGHWTVTYLTHNPGPGRWTVPGAGVQASNLVGAGFITMGECWHNNHHAFPESAKIGLAAGEVDPGWTVLRWLESGGWVWNLGLPRRDTEQEDLARAA
jgi:stearoyl-CoA desaturase (delta-9 desaturase)